MDDSTAETELVKAYVQRRDEHAFAELVSRHMPMVLGVCRRVLDDEHAAHDAAQAVFLCLARKAGTLGTRRPLAGWLHHVAVCVARNERVARARRLRREEEAAKMQQQTAEVRLTPEEETVLREWLDPAIDALPEKYRQPFVMVHLEGRSLEETAGLLACRDGTLRVWLSRAREKLRTGLVRRGVRITGPALVAWLATQGESAAASVPADLASQAAQQAITWMASGVAAGSAAHAVALAKGAMQTMFIGKLKTAAAVAASVAIVSTASAVSWQKVTQARQKGLPKTAIQELQPIIVDAMQNRRYAEATKAVALKIALEAQVEGNKPEEKVMRMAVELKKAPPEMTPLMQAIQASWIWEYYLANHWRIRQRSATAASVGDDIRAWDLARLLQEIDRHFRAALAHDAVLKATPIAQFEELLEKGSMPDSYRPTLYDFLAHEAIQFYQAGEQGAIQGENVFVLDAQSPIFDDATAFVQWRPKTTATNDPILKAVGLLQDLTAFHEDDEIPDARADADLLRLAFGWNQATGDTKSARYKAALERFVAQWADHEVSDRALYQWASVLNGEGAFVEAHKLATRGLQTYAASIGGIWCYNLLQQIEAKSLTLSGERVWNAPWPTLDVSYRNVDKAHFRAIPMDFKTYHETFAHIPDGEKLKVLLTQEPALAWSEDLPLKDDYSTQSAQLAVPTELPKGHYIILASHAEDFGREKNVLAYREVWVSDLALIVRNHAQPSNEPRRPIAFDGFVLNAESGNPIAGATVRLYHLAGRPQILRPNGVTQTDANGMFQFARDGNGMQCYVVAETAADRVASEHQFSRNNYQTGGSAWESVVFFTDRGLYRPGQTMHYKGIASVVDRAKNEYRVLPNRTITVALRDASGKEVATAEHVSNDFGSFSGSFAAPRGLTGQMHLRVTGKGPSGSTTFQVEEYKRPKFQVTASAPKAAVRLDETVTVTGKATAYTGAALDAAKVQWRVVRGVEYPDWCWWGHFWGGYGQQQAIAHGEARTDNNGAFEIAFEAVPDAAVPEESEPVFVYTVYADVTDPAGETRSSSRTVRVGYTALQASLGSSNWLTTDAPVTLDATIQTHDHQGIATQAVLTICTLKQPEKVVRDTLDSAPYANWSFRKASGGFSIPVDVANPRSWETNAIVASVPVTTTDDGKASVSNALPAGVYRAVLETEDPYGKKVTAQHTFVVIDPAAGRFPLKVAAPVRRQTGVGGARRNVPRRLGHGLRLGPRLRRTGPSRQGPAELVDRCRQHADGHRANRDAKTCAAGSRCALTHVRENRVHLEAKVIQVPWSNKKLNIAWERFRSNLEPGKPETWTAVITGPNAEKAAAEMVACLYDASLDQFRPHNWMQAFGGFYNEQNYVYARFQNDRETLRYLLHGWSPDSKSTNYTYRHFPAEIVLQPSRYEYIYEVFGGRAGGGRSAGYDRDYGDFSLRAGDYRKSANRWGTERTRLAYDANGGNGALVMDKRTYDPAGSPFPEPAATGDAGAGPDLAQVTRAPQPAGDRLLLPAPDQRRRRRGTHRLHHARGVDGMEVPGLRPRRRPAQRIPDRYGRNGQGSDGAAQPAALRPGRRRGGIHGQGQQSVGHPPGRLGTPDVRRRAHAGANGRRTGLHARLRHPTRDTRHATRLRYPHQGIPHFLVADQGSRRYANS